MNILNRAMCTTHTVSAELQRVIFSVYVYLCAYGYDRLGVLAPTSSISATINFTKPDKNGTMKKWYCHYSFDKDLGSNLFLTLHRLYVNLVLVFSLLNEQYFYSLMEQELFGLLSSPSSYTLRSCGSSTVYSCHPA